MLAIRRGIGLEAQPHPGVQAGVQLKQDGIGTRSDGGQAEERHGKGDQYARACKERSQDASIQGTGFTRTCWPGRISTWYARAREKAPISEESANARDRASCLPAACRTLVRALSRNTTRSHAIGAQKPRAHQSTSEA